MPIISLFCIFVGTVVLSTFWPEIHLFAIIAEIYLKGYYAKLRRNLTQ